MKIVLVFPPFYLDSMYNLPPLGLVNLATALQDLPHKIMIIDFVLEIRRGLLKLDKDIYAACAERILEERPDLVGFSTQCATYPGVIQISKNIRSTSPHVKIVIGGHNASFVDRETLESYPFIDAVVRGEGEQTFRELIISCLKGEPGEGVDGVTFRKGKEVVRNADRPLLRNLDELPLPDYRLLPPLSVYRDACRMPRSIAILEVGRGCPHNCIYCSESIFWKRRSRTHSVDRLIKEMVCLREVHGAECFLLAYDQFTAGRNFVETFCRRLIEEGLSRVPWYCISRLDSVDAGLLALMREAGCESMCYGIDSGSKRTLKFIRKGINLEILYPRVRQTAEQGIIPTLSFVIGFPEEKREDIDQTLLLALKAGILGNNNPLIQMPTVLPGTDLQKQYGDCLVREVDTYFSLGIEFDKGRRLGSDEEIINSSPRIFSSFYNLPCRGVSLKDLNLISSFFPLIARLYPKSFLLLSTELGESVSGLFIRFLKWVKGIKGTEEFDLSPRDCYTRFSTFVSDNLPHPLTKKHLPDVLKYENCAIEAGRYDRDVTVFSIDLNRIEDLSPLKNPNMILERFDHDLPLIIEELQNGLFRDSYPEKECFLAFRQDRDVLDVTELNAFAHDFAKQCTGKAGLRTICSSLYQRYGGGLTLEEFFDSCVEAARQLAEMGYICRSPLNE